MAVKRLQLSKDGVIGGVAGGVAEYLNVDPTIVRLIFVFGFFTSWGIIAYIAGMILLPSAEDEDDATDNAVNELKKAAAELTQSGGQLAEDMIGKIRVSLEKLGQEDKEGNLEKKTQNPGLSQRNLGLLLLIIGVVVLSRNLLPFIPWGSLWPVAIIALGVVLIGRGVGSPK